MRESFYTRVFGWDFSLFQGPEDFWPLSTDMESSATSGAAAKLDSASQAIAVVSLDDAAQRILDQGGKILTAPIAIRGGYLLYCQDTDGHAFGIVESDSMGEDYEKNRPSSDD